MDKVSQMRYNSQELMNMANYLRNNADFDSNSVEFRLGQLATAWTGPAADEFANKVRSLMQRAKNMKSTLYNALANRLGQTATDLERATATIISGINRF